MTPPKPLCSTHKTPMVVFCPRCRGSAGGKVVTPKKRRMLARIAKLPRPGRRKDATEE